MRKRKVENLKIQIELPRDLLGALDVSEEELGPWLKAVVVLDLFQKNRISSGKAAEMLGLSKQAFIGLLNRHELPYFTETPGELVTQVAAAERKLDSTSS